MHVRAQFIFLREMVHPFDVCALYILYLLCSISYVCGWKTGESFQHEGQTTFSKTREGVFNVTVLSPCLDFTWTIHTHDEQITVFVMEEVNFYPSIYPCMPQVPMARV